MIEQSTKKRMLIYSGSSNSELAKKVANELGTELAEVEKEQFASGEIYIRLADSARGADCFVLQSHSGGINFTIMEQLLIVDALKRASAKRITAVLPFYPYSRQDKKALPREPISAGSYAEFVIDKVRIIQENGKVPIICGGAGLYYRAIKRGIFKDSISDKAIKEIKESMGV